jgi:Mce-associated membrane protein
MVTRDDQQAVVPARPRRPGTSRTVRRRSVVRATRQAGREPDDTVILDAIADGPSVDEIGVDEAAVDEATVDEATVDEAAADQTAPEEVAPAKRRSSLPPHEARRWRLVAAILLVALVVTVVATGMLGRRWYDQQQLDTARQQALAAARQTTVNFVSISAGSVDRDLQRIADAATGQFKDEFTRDTAQVRAAVVANKVESSGSVLRAAVVSADKGSAVVLVAIDATVKNTSAPTGRLSHYRIQVNLVRDAHTGHWLVSQLQFVG